MIAQKKNYVLLLLSVVGIVVISLFSSRIVPLYDGVGFPDEPYRYVKPPASALKTALQPSPAETVITISQGTNPVDFNLTSREQGPQSSFYVYHKALKVSSAVNTASFKATPMAPDNNKPKIGQIAGNFYRFTATEPKSGVTFVSANGLFGYADLRLPQGFPAGATFVYRSNASSKWQKVDTRRVGSDIYEAHMQGFGDYALVPSKENISNRPGSPFLIIYILTVVVIILSVVLFVLRHRHKKSKARKKDR